MKTIRTMNTNMQTIRTIHTITNHYENYETQAIHHGNIYDIQNVLNSNETHTTT